MLLPRVVEELTKSVKGGMFGGSSEVCASECVSTHRFDPFPKSVNLISSLLRTCWGTLISSVFLQMVISAYRDPFGLCDILVIQETDHSNCVGENFYRIFHNRGLSTKYAS